MTCITKGQVDGKCSSLAADDIDERYYPVQRALANIAREVQTGVPLDDALKRLSKENKDVWIACNVLLRRRLPSVEADEVIGAVRQVMAEYDQWTPREADFHRAAAVIAEENFVPIRAKQIGVVSFLTDHIGSARPYFEKLVGESYKHRMSSLSPSERNSLHGAIYMLASWGVDVSTAAGEPTLPEILRIHIQQRRDDHGWAPSQSVHLTYWILKYHEPGISAIASGRRP